MIKKKHLLVIGFVIVLIFISIRIYTIRTSIHLPNFSVRDSLNNLYNVNSLQKNEKLLFLHVTNDNFFNDFIQEFDPKIEINVIFLTKKPFLKLKKIKGYYHSEEIDVIDKIYKQFKFDKEKNYLLHFDKIGYYLGAELLTPPNKLKILTKFSKRFKLLRGDTKLISEYLENEMKIIPGEVVLFAQKVNKNCICFRNFELLEEYFDKKGKLKVIVIGDWTERDTYNFLRERDFKIKVEKAPIRLNQLISKWTKETKRDDFNAVKVNLGGTNKYFLLLDRNDFGIWYQFTNKQFGFNERVL